MGRPVTSFPVVTIRSGGTDGGFVGSLRDGTSTTSLQFGHSINCVANSCGASNGWLHLAHSKYISGILCSSRPNGRQRQATGGIDAADRDIFVFFTVSGFEVVGSCERHGQRRYSGDNRVPGVHAANSASFALHTARKK